MTDKIECEAFLGGTKRIPKEKFVFRPAVYGIIIHRGRVLLVNTRRTGNLYLPGGGVDIGEKIEDALKREVKEETGLDVDIKEFMGFKDGLFYYDPLDEAFHSFLFFYHCIPLTLDLLENNQIDDGEVIDPHWERIESVQAQRFQNHGDMIVKFLQKISAR